MNMTLKTAKAELAAVGCTISKTDGEYKVRLKGSPVGHGYFTTDLDDAVATGRHMANEEVRRASVAADRAEQAQQAQADESFPDGVNRIMRAKMAELKADGTVAMSADNFFSLCVQAISRHPKSFKGVNACYLARNVFNIAAKTPAFISFVYHN